LEGVSVDAKYAYWTGYHLSAYDSTIRESTLHRVDLETGAVARLNLPGVAPDSSLRLLAQDDTRLFLWSNGALLSLRKP
jgi:hypothetical protein